MSSLQAFRREDGTVGIRNHLFILPAVVCANQVAIDLSRRHPALKYIEHQHGCAQIGADLIQTERVFSHLAQHSNVYASVFVGLGCEGIIAKDLFAKASHESDKPMELVIIQQAGGTLGAEAVAEEWMESRNSEVKTQVRTAAKWDEITIGFLSDDVPDTKSPLLDACLESLWDLGVNLVLPKSHAWRTHRLGQVTEINYGDTATGRLVSMQEGSNALETLTGLTAAGLHLIIHLAQWSHGFGNPLVPVVRWCLNEPVYHQFHDDFDGQFQDELDIPRLIEQLSRVINGQASVAEELGMDDFALYRIGPTV